MTVRQRRKEECRLNEISVFLIAIILAMFIQLLVGRFKLFITDRATALIAVMLGVLLCIIYQAGILAMLGLVAQVPYGEYVDYVLTGIAVSGGASVITDFASNLGQVIVKKQI